MCAELIVQRVDRALGSDWSYWRITLADRHYVPVSSRLTLAQRVLVQSIVGDAPYTGKSLALSNTELRWRAADFEALGRSFHLVTSGFVDAGRVWEEGLEARQFAAGLHGARGGIRVGMGENFVVALDIGHSREAAAPFYIGLGYLY